jgi:hypothetical protein
MKQQPFDQIRFDQRRWIIHAEAFFTFQCVTSDVEPSSASSFPYLPLM